MDEEQQPIDDMGPTHGVTAELRFVQRDKKFILQQLWLPGHSNYIQEWRDVPIAEE